MFLTIEEINKKFGKDTVCFGDQLGNLDYDKLLDSNDFNLLKSEADKLLKTYQQIDKQLIAFSKACTASMGSNKGIGISIFFKTILSLLTLCSHAVIILG